jgi:Zn-dependent protease with chaperone function
MLTLGIYYASRLWENVKSQRLWTGGAEKISYNQKMHLALLCLYLAYFLSSIGIVISFSTGILIVQIKSGIELVAIFMPSIIVCIVFICIQGRKYLHLRREILNQTTRFELRGYHTDIEIFSVENLEATAFVVNLAFSDPKILIDRQLIEKSDHKEIAAIYFHEMYHIHSKTSNYQRVVNVPVVGPMFFLAFINPEEVYAEEFRADEFAAEKVGREVVISAIEAANEETHIRSNSSSTASDFQKILNFLELITTVPVVGIYRPTRRQRIQNLKEIQP